MHTRAAIIRHTFTSLKFKWARATLLFIKFNLFFSIFLFIHHNLLQKCCRHVIRRHVQMVNDHVHLPSLIVENILHETDVLLCDELHDERFDIIAGTKKLFSYQLFEVVLYTFVGTACPNASCRRCGRWRGQLQANLAVVQIQMHEFFQKIRAHDVRCKIEIDEIVFGANAIEDNFGCVTFGRIV